MAFHRHSEATRAGILATALGVILAVAPAATAHEDISGDGGFETDGRFHQHGGDEGHLPPSDENVDVISKLRLTNKDGHIGDVGVHKGYAYLAGYWEPDCSKGGMYVADIRNPAAPKKVSFIPTSPGSYVGEGSQTITVTTPKFSGDLLAFNNEICGEQKAADGGMTLVDVSDPAEPKRLVEHAGDIDPETGKAHQIHSVFIWDAGDKAYAVIVDDEETADVDIMDITDPRNPVMVREYDLVKDFPDAKIAQETPENLTQVFLHDMIVKEIDGKQIMLLSYWDGGYVQLDVTDPAYATYIGDSDYEDVDPELLDQTGRGEPPEGNGHQAEFTKDNDYFFATDEDFSPTFLEGTTDDDTPETFTGGQGSGTTQVGLGETLSGTTVYGGRACNGDAAVPAAPATGDAQIAVITRGLCTFTEKVANVANAGGYEGIIIVNREPACGEFGMSVDGELPTFSVTRETGFLLFDNETYNHEECLAAADNPTFDPNSLEASLIPGVEQGETGDVVTIKVDFNGWGYVHLYSNQVGADGKFDDLDTYAIPEAMDPEKSSGSGDLSVHEVATSHVENDLAYFAYYSGGFRVTRIVGNDIQEVGHFIDEGGNNFWGVQVFEHDGKEYVAASDRDFGLYIFEYTGP